jgi:hypothetical protein
MTRNSIGLTRALALGCLLAAAPVLASPGDPLGGDDTGCAPSTKLGLSCAKKVHNALWKLRVRVIKCHLTQAEHAFKNGQGEPGFSNAEENCEIGPSNTSAKNKFDARLASLATYGCDATVLANAAAAGDVIVSDQSVAGSMDNLNASFFCDATSGNLIDPGGDDGGYIPATPENFKCSTVVAKSWAKLDGYLYKCHSKLALSVFADRVFDEEVECEDRYAPRIDANIQKYITIGFCPPCLADPPGALGLTAALRADSDANLEDVYICPGP